MVVVTFNNSKGSKFSDMPVVVSGADLNWVVLCNIAIWVCAVCLVLLWIWLLSGAVLCRYLINDICDSFVMSGYFVFLLYLKFNL